MAHNVADGVKWDSIVINTSMYFLYILFLFITIFTCNQVSALYQVSGKGSCYKRKKKQEQKSFLGFEFHNLGYRQIEISKL